MPLLTKILLNSTTSGPRRWMLLVRIGKALFYGFILHTLWQIKSYRKLKKHLTSLDVFSCQNGSPKTGFWNTWIAVLHSVRFIILTPTRADTHIIHPHAITTARGDQARLPTPAHSELRSQPAFRVRGLYVRAYGQLRVTPARSHAIPRRLASRGSVTTRGFRTL